MVKFGPPEYGPGSHLVFIGPEFQKDLVISGNWSPTVYAKSVCFSILFSFMFLPFLLS